MAMDCYDFRWRPRRGAPLGRHIARSRSDAAMMVLKHKSTAKARSAFGSPHRAIAERCSDVCSVLFELLPFNLADGITELHLRILNTERLHAVIAALGDTKELTHILKTRILALITDEL